MNWTFPYCPNQANFAINWRELEDKFEWLGFDQVVFGKNLWLIGLPMGIFLGIVSAIFAVKILWYGIESNIFSNTL